MLCIIYFTSFKVADIDFNISYNFSLGGHSALDPPLPIPNRAVKRSCADDSVYTHVKVGHRQAPNCLKKPHSFRMRFFFTTNYQTKLQIIILRALIYCYSAWEVMSIKNDSLNHCFLVES